VQQNRHHEAVQALLLVAEAELQGPQEDRHHQLLAEAESAPAEFLLRVGLSHHVDKDLPMEALEDRRLPRVEDHNLPRVEDHNLSQAHRDHQIKAHQEEYQQAGFQDQAAAGHLQPPLIQVLQA